MATPKFCRSPTSTGACREACQSWAHRGGDPIDKVEVGGAVNGLSAPHRDFLEADFSRSQLILSLRTRLLMIATPCSGAFSGAGTWAKTTRLSLRETQRD